MPAYLTVEGSSARPLLLAEVGAARLQPRARSTEQDNLKKRRAAVRLRVSKLYLLRERTSPAQPLRKVKDYCPRHILRKKSVLRRRALAKRARAIRLRIRTRGIKIYRRKHALRMVRRRLRRGKVRRKMKTIKKIRRHLRARRKLSRANVKKLFLRSRYFRKTFDNQRNRFQAP